MSINTKKLIVRIKDSHPIKNKLKNHPQSNFEDGWEAALEVILDEIEQLQINLNNQINCNKNSIEIL